MTVFYRKYRPQRLSEIIGQENITKILLSQLESGKISHGYLFAGPRGTGKTSTARILAKAVNCVANRLTTNAKRKKDDGISPSALSVQHFSEPCNKCESCLAISLGSHLDLIEIDAASNRGIDEIRDLREKIRLSPVSGRFKVYIIDEAHMLTTEAFNALLKTLEEPPAHAIFILCTTEPQKLPATIISRLSRFNFSRAKDADLSWALLKIAKSEELKIEKEAVDAIAHASDGSFRDAISILDQLSGSNSKISQKDVNNIVRASGWNQIYAFVESLANKDLVASSVQIEEIVAAGGDVELFVNETILFLEKILLSKIGVREPFDSGDADKMQALAGKINYVDIQNLMKLLLVAESEIKQYPLAQIPLILAVCKFCPEPATTEYTEVANAEGAEAMAGKPAVASALAGKQRMSQGQSQSEKLDREREAVPEVKLDKVKSKKSTGSLSEVEKQWGAILNKLKPINSHVVALLRSSRPSIFDGKQLTIEVFYRFHKEKLEEPKILMMIESVFSEVMDKKLVLKFVLAQRTSQPTREVAMSDVIDANQDEIANLASEIFSK